MENETYYCMKSKQALESGFISIQIKSSYCESVEWETIDMEYMSWFPLQHEDAYYNHSSSMIDYYTCVLFGDDSHIPLPLIFDAIWPRWCMSNDIGITDDDYERLHSLQVRSVRKRIWPIIRENPAFYGLLQLVADLYVFDISDDIIGIDYKYRVPSYACEEIKIHAALKNA